MEKEIIKQFRSIFKPIVGTPKGYEGSTMLYVPYEEMVHYLEKSLSDQREKIKSDLLKIADSGEFEDLRREVIDYFNQLKKI